MSGLLRCRNIERYSSPARGSVKVIETLLAEATTRPANTADRPIRKMSFDTMSSGSDPDSQSGGLQRAVRRLVQTNGVATSPMPPAVDTPSPAVNGASPAPAVPLARQAVGAAATAGSTPSGGSLRSPPSKSPADAAGKTNGSRPALQHLSQSLPADLPGVLQQQQQQGATSRNAASTDMPPPQFLPTQPQQQVVGPGGFDASTASATFGGWGDGSDFFSSNNLGFGTFGGQINTEVGIPPNDASFVDKCVSPWHTCGALWAFADGLVLPPRSDLMSQILSLPDLDWMLGPNGGPFRVSPPPYSS